MVMFPEFYQSTGATIFYFMLAGGVSYTIGALCYAAKRPNLLPSIFGYHELFHSFVILGAGLHYVSIYARYVEITDSYHQGTYLDSV